MIDAHGCQYDDDISLSVLGQGGMCEVISGLKEYHVGTEIGREGVVTPQSRFQG